jgi:serine/threonine protein kinase
MPLNKPFPTGTVINNRYRIGRLLGKGGFGAVYLAWDSQLDKPCAVKENFDPSPEAQHQFEREASILADLEHANLPCVKDHFTVPGQGEFLVMDFVEGEDLQEKLDLAGAPLPEEQVVPWILQVLDALAYLHELQPPVIHRDIKPANIRITPDGKAMLVDFGIAKLYDPQKQTTLGARAVTPGYSPFEQYGQKSTDVRTDIYALGATLYTLLTGVQPSESIGRIAGAHLSKPRTINPAISPGTENVILKAMEIQPDRRFQGAREFKNALQLPAGGIITPAARKLTTLKTVALAVSLIVILVLACLFSFMFYNNIKGLWVSSRAGTATFTETHSQRISSITDTPSPSETIQSDPTSTLGTTTPTLQAENPGPKKTKKPKKN